MSLCLLGKRRPVRLRNVAGSTVLNRSQKRSALSLAVLVSLSAGARAQVEPIAEITVIGRVEALPGGLRERSLDEDAIAGFGVSSVDDLVSELRSEMGDDEENEPVYLLNGQRVRNLNDIGGLPLEAIKEVEVLPAGSSGVPGVSPTARVYNIVLKAAVKSETAIVAPKIATDGGWAQARVEGVVTRVEGQKRTNITVRARSEDALLESERNIVQLGQRRPSDFAGNVIADPRIAGDEIDPRLSAAAGTRVTTAAVPGNTTPTLSDFVRGANVPNTSNPGMFRSLRPKTNFYEARVSHANRLNDWLTGSISSRFSYTGNKSLTGLSTGLFVLPASNPFTPFSQSVGLAKYGDPLRQGYRRLEGSGDVELKATFGEWRVNFHALHQRTETRSEADRQDPAQLLQPIVLANNVNPFAPGLVSQLAIGLDRSRYRTRGTTVEADAKGQPFRVPAGPVDLGIDTRLTWTALKSARTFLLSDTASRLRRNERELHSTLNIPLTSRDNDVLSAIGNLSANFEYGRIGFSDAPHADRYHYGLSWTPREGIRFDASSYHARQTPAVETLGEPITFTTGVRVLDLLRGDTIDVTQITGGNPTLRAERLALDRASVNVMLIKKLKFNLYAEYQSIDRYDFISTLPRESVPIWLSFPERFARDDTGRLTAVDFRPVNFELQHQERLRYGIGLNLPVGGAGAEADKGPQPPSRWRVRVSAMHTITMENRLDVGPGIAPVDLLNGGALGIAGGRPRHQVDFSLNVGRGGTGLRMTGVYRGANYLQIRGITGGPDLLTFRPFTTLNLYAFAEMGTLFQETSWLKGSRIGIYAANLTNARQRVTNGAGVTPLRYQANYRDPLGRTIELEFRKQF